MDLAKEMTKEALPIKCLEAVILGMYPSSGLGETGSDWPSLACCCEMGRSKGPGSAPSVEQPPKVEEFLPKGGSSCYLPRPAGELVFESHGQGDPVFRTPT